MVIQPVAPQTQPLRRFRPMLIVLGMTAGFMVVEAVSGVLTGSLALLSDAGHMLTDSVALSLALLAMWLAHRSPPSGRLSFGYLRGEIVAAQVNGVILWALVALIFWQAYHRFQSPPEVKTLPMLIVATLGLVVNLIGGALLMRGAAGSLNVRAAFLNVVGDALGSLGAITASVLMLRFGWYLADPIASVFIGLLILYGSARLVLSTLHVLMEGTPTGLDLARMEESLRSSYGIRDVHDIHAWTLTSGYNAMSAHVIVSDEVPLTQHPQVLDTLRRLLTERFPVQHVTIQIEEGDFCCDEFHSPSRQLQKKG